jgi:hypothetical protein
VIDLEELRRRRFRNWCQDGDCRIEDPEAAKPFIERVGVCTLFGASTEFPSLYQAHMGESSPPSFATWDSPSGYVYTWRWNLGKSDTAFYGSIVARKPTWVAYRLLAPLLGALMERRSVEELYEAGELSADALRVAKALEAAEEALVTKDLRDAAGFTKGKENRSAYLKAVEELENRLILCKRFTEGEGDEGMRHALVRKEYPEVMASGLALEPTSALTELLRPVLANAVYLDPKVVVRHLRISPDLVDRALEGLDAVRQTVGKVKVFVVKEEAR